VLALQALKEWLTLGQINMKRASLQAGFTLIELLLYVAIVGALLLSVTGFYSVALDARVKNQAVSEVNQQGAYVMDEITQTIRNATSITLPIAAGSGSTLTLVVPTATLSPTTFSLSGTTLQIAQGTGTAVALTNSRVQVSNLVFKNLTRSGTNGIVQVSYTVAYANTAGRNTFTYQQNFISSAEVGW